MAKAEGSGGSAGAGRGLGSRYWARAVGYKPKTTARDRLLERADLVFSQVKPREGTADVWAIDNRYITRGGRIMTLDGLYKWANRRLGKKRQVRIIELEG